MQSVPFPIKTAFSQIETTAPSFKKLMLPKQRYYVSLSGIRFSEKDKEYLLREAYKYLSF
jgi:hypothetical protein